jgi:hypothetical protein
MISQDAACRAKARSLRAPPGWPSVLASIAAASVVLPAQLEGAVCTLTGTGEWGPIDTWTGSDDCGGALTPHDTFVVSGNAAVVDDIEQSATQVGISVAPGGVLEAVADASGSPRIAVGAQGLAVSGSVRFVGGFRQWGDPVPELQAGPDPWPLGRIVACPDPTGASDCNSGNRNLIRMVYSDSEYPYAAAAIGAIVPGEDALCFWDFDLSDDAVPVDVNYCYRIVAKQTGADAYFEVNVEQGELDQFGYPLARRHLVETAIVSGFEITEFNPYGGITTPGVEEGDRGLCVDEATPSGWVALWARPGTARPARSARIRAVARGGYHRLHRLRLGNG